jgi:hypothetical protein
MDFEYEDCSTWLLPVRFTFSTLRFDYFPEPIKERSLLSRESQQRQQPLPMRFPPDFKALHHRSLPHPDLQRYETTLRIPENYFAAQESFVRSLFLVKEFIFEI